MIDKFAMFKLFILFFVAGVVFYPLIAQNSQNISILSQTTPDFSEAYNVMLDGNRAYVTCSGTINGRLRAFDATNQARPVEIGEIFFPENTSALTVKANYLYCIVGGVGLRIYNVASVQNPILVGQVDNSVYGYKIIVEDGYLYVRCEHVIKVFNVSNPNNPYFVSNISCGDIIRFTVNGNYLYLTYDGDPPMPGNTNHYLMGVSVYNISNHAQPVYNGGFECLPGFAADMKVAGNYLYISNFLWGLMIVNISNPSAPFVQSSLTTTSYTSLLHINGNSVCLAEGGNGLWFVDITNPASPQTQAHTTISDHSCSDMALTGNYLYVANRGLTVFNISNPEQVEQVYNLYRQIRIEEVAVSGNFAYAVEYNQGLRIFDVTDLHNPQQVGYFAMDNAQRVAVEGHHAYLAGGTSGMYILNISNPANPQVAGFYPYTVSILEVNGSYVYTSTGSQYFMVIDVSNPALPERIYTINFGITNAPAFTKIKKSGNRVYLGTLYSGMKILDATDPAAPVLVSTAATTNGVRDIDIYNGYAYLANFSDAIDIIDVSNSANPVTAGSFIPNDYNCYAISIVGDYAYLALSNSGIYAYHLGNPLSPVLAGFYDTAGLSSDIAMQNDYAFVADRYCMGIYDCSEAVGVEDYLLPEPSTDIIISSYPNPFSKSVSINIELNKSGDYEISIYNIKGQKVNSLHNGILSKGSNLVKWDGTDSKNRKLSNGCYLLQVDFQHQKTIHKLMLTR